MSRRQLTTTVAAAAIGLAVGAAATFMLITSNGTSSTSEAGSQRAPLYWVAPMDPDYRRDEPGKSPMGMDLIPVYEEDGIGEGAGPGTIRISPDVVNNLGVRTAIVEQGQLQSEINTVGYLQYDQSQLTHVSPRIAGWIDALHVKATGDRVAKGQPLYALYSPELVNAQQELLMALRQNNRQLIEAAEQRLSAWQIPSSFVAELRESREIRQAVVYRAPKDAYLESLNIRQGEFVQPGQVLMALATLDNIWVEAQVFANQAHLVEAGLPVTMTLDYLPRQTWQGEVDYVYPTVDAVTRALPARIRFTNEDGELKPNMFADLTIHGRDDAETTVVPKEAVIRTGQMDRVVLALGDGQFKSIAVMLGRSDDENMEIVEGVQPGERVVTSAQFLLDSESSKTSDFKRLHHGDESRNGGGEMDMDAGMDMDMSAQETDATPTPEVVHTEATINNVMAEDQRLNVTHAPIEAWGWPAMTMDFDVSGQVDLSELEAGLEVLLEIEKKEDGTYTIKRLSVGGEEKNREQMDHEQHDSDATRDQQMDHSQMGHSNGGMEAHQ